MFNIIKSFIIINGAPNKYIFIQRHRMLSNKFFLYIVKKIDGEQTLNQKSRVYFIKVSSILKKNILSTKSSFLISYVKSGALN